MEVDVNITMIPDFTDCPDCREDFEMIVEILYAASDFEEELRSYGIDFDNENEEVYIIKLPCGGSITVEVSDDQVDVTKFLC
jgi:hypothetical protein